MLVFCLVIQQRTVTHGEDKCTMTPVPPASTLHTVIAAVIRLLLPYATSNTTIVAHCTLGSAHLKHCITKRDWILWRYAQNCMTRPRRPSTVALVASATVGPSALSSQHEALGGEAATGPRLAVECLATVRQSTCWNLFEIML